MLAGWDYTFLANESFVKQLVKDDNKYVVAESGILLRHLIWENCSTVPASSRVKSTWLGLTMHLAVRAMRVSCRVSCRACSQHGRGDASDAKRDRARVV